MTNDYRRLIKERQASFPASQFRDEVNQELQRLTEDCDFPSYAIFNDAAIRAQITEIIKKKWVDQGIWDQRWVNAPCGRWLHEMETRQKKLVVVSGPKVKIEPDTASTPDPKIETGIDQASGSNKRKATEPASDSYEKRQKMGPDHPASRPFQRFMAQMHEEVLRMQNNNVSDKNEKLKHLFGASLPGRHMADAFRSTAKPPSPPKPFNPTNTVGRTSSAGSFHGANSDIYERVKKNWVMRGIWDERWGTMPGMFWKHEQSIADLFREKMQLPWRYNGIASIEKENWLEIAEATDALEKRVLSACLSALDEPQVVSPGSPRATFVDLASLED